MKRNLMLFPLALSGLSVALWLLLTLDHPLLTVPPELPATGIFAPQTDSLYANPKQILFVDQKASTKGKGSEQAPFSTITAALNRATPGTTIKIAPGDYQESLALKTSGTPGEPIIIEGSSTKVTSLQSLPTEEQDSLIAINNQQHIFIRNLTLETFWTDAQDITPKGISISGKSSHILIENVTITNLGTTAKNGNAHGIAIYGEEKIENIRLKNNHLHHLTLGFSEAIAINSNVSNFLIDDNEIHDTDNIGIDIIGYEKTSRINDVARHGIIRNNRLKKISSQTNPAYAGSLGAGGIYVDGGQDILIENNHVTDSDIGIEVASEHPRKFAKNVTIRHNKLLNNTYTGLAIGGYEKGLGGVKKVLISDNQLLKNDLTDLQGGQLLIQFNVNDVLIENNQFHQSDSQLLIVSEEGLASETVLKNNDYQGQGGLWKVAEENFDSEANFSHVKPGKKRP